MKVTRIRDKLKRNEKWQIEYLTPSSFKIKTRINLDNILPESVMYSIMLLKQRYEK